MKNPLTSKNLNFRIGRRLEEVADLLEAQQGNPFRVRAHRRAAETLRRSPGSAEDILRREGEPDLRRLPGIGEGLARSIATSMITGKLPMLDRLRGESESGSLLASVPGIGKRLAARLQREHGIKTLEELATAAHDERLRSIRGVGDKRIAGIMDSLSARLSRVRPLRVFRTNAEPSLGELLDVNREFREKAAAGTLLRITPRRFNPHREAWLPILHTKKAVRHYVALFSNTARAHRMGKTRDWVVLYYDGGGGERQFTVITSQRSLMAGQRIVRGRERECLEYYRQGENEPSTASNRSSIADPASSYDGAATAGKKAYG